MGQHKDFLNFFENRVNKANLKQMKNPNRALCMDGKTFRHLFEPETRRLDQNVIKGIKETSFRGLTAESFYDNLFKEAVTNVNGSVNAMVSDGQVSY